MITIDLQLVLTSDSNIPYRVNAKLQEDIEYVNRCDWSEDRKELWHSNYDLWRSKCGPIVMKHLNKVMEMEEAS